MIFMLKIEKFSSNEIDAVIYINLEKRNDRKELILEELEKLGIPKNKIHKVSGVYIPKNGHKGCVQSHMLALQMAKFNKWQRVLILEDDAELTLDPKDGADILKKVLQVPNWDVFMLGTCYKQISGIVSSIGDDLLVEKVKLSTTSTAYLIKYHYIDTLMEVFKKSNDNMSSEKLSEHNSEPWALDQQWISLQSKDNWYCLNKDLFRQRNINSTILSESHSQ